MRYRFASERADRSALAGGSALVSAPGVPALPARLSSEIFQQAVADRAVDAPVRMLDPCCGGAYMVTVIGLLHGDQLEHVAVSDVDSRALELARRNLRLLTSAGRCERKHELRELSAKWGRPSHRYALNNLEQISRMAGTDVVAEVRQVDALEPGALARRFGGSTFNLILTDVPYGWQTEWLGPWAQGSRVDNLACFLGALQEILVEGGVLAVASAKGVLRDVPFGDLMQRRRSKIGHREVRYFLKAGP